VSFAATTLCVASQRMFIVVIVSFVINFVRKLLDIPSYKSLNIYVPADKCWHLCELPMHDRPSFYAIHT